MPRFKVETRPAPDYDAKVQAQPSWIVLTYRDGSLINSKRFNGEHPRRTAQSYAKTLRIALKGT